MKFHQKPPDQPGYYYALPVGEKELTVVRVRDLHAGNPKYGPTWDVQCVMDAGHDCPTYSYLNDYVLWSVEKVQFPEFELP